MRKLVTASTAAPMPTTEEGRNVPTFRNDIERMSDAQLRELFVDIISRMDGPQLDAVAAVIRRVKDRRA